jgi:NADPH-dependent 2,4-dienoyl-CoA reductase/sulfur reductase-like enzyme/Rieske Fe-S protein
MHDVTALALPELPEHSMKAVELNGIKILLVRVEDIGTTGSAASPQTEPQTEPQTRPQTKPQIFAVEAECPHAKAPLAEGAVCNGRLICPWHAGTFELKSGTVIEPPPLRDLKRYEVRVDGDRIMVSLDPPPAAHPTPVCAEKHVVLAGFGAAGAAALCFLREHGFAGNITVVDPVADEPIDRTALSKNALAGQMPLDKLPMMTADEREHLIEKSGSHVAYNHIACAVTDLDQAAETLYLSNGNTLKYDALLLATGGRPRLPGIEGERADNVFTLRHASDLQALETYIGKGRRCVIDGDGFIAFEAASALTQRGVDVTIVARSQEPLAAKFGPEAAESILSLHRKHGVAVLHGEELEAIGNGTVTLRSGRKLPADFVLLAIGVDPITAFACKTPLGEASDCRLDVNASLKLSHNVWAAGDIVAMNGVTIEHWRVAQQHGRVAAAAMLEQFSALKDVSAPTKYDGVPFFWTAHFGKNFRYAGHAETWDAIELDGNPTDHQFLAYYLRGNRVAAVLGCGRDAALAALTESMRTSLTLEQARAIAAAYPAQAASAKAQAASSK